MSPPANSSGSIRHGHLLLETLSAGWSAFKAAQKATWLLLWLSSLDRPPTSRHHPFSTRSRFRSRFHPCERVKAAPQAVEVNCWRAREKGPKGLKGRRSADKPAKEDRGQAGQGGPRTSRPRKPADKPAKEARGQAGHVIPSGERLKQHPVSTPRSRAASQCFSLNFAMAPATSAPIRSHRIGMAPLRLQRRARG